MDSTEVPPNFVTVINDFTNDLTTTFPEYSDRWNNLTGTIDDSSRDEIYKYCVTVYPERFFDILYQNADIFSDKPDVNVNFLPNVDFKILYNSEGVTENIRKTIWKYLQLVLFTVVGSVKDKSTFGDSMNMFEGIDEKDLQEKLGETMEGLNDFFKDMGKNESSEGESSTGQEQSTPFNMNGMPNMENMQEHLHTLFNGKIGSLAKEMAEEISGDFTELLGDNSGVLPQVKSVLADLYEEYIALDKRIKLYDKKVTQVVTLDKDCRCLKTIPGFGPLSASAFACLAKDQPFTKGRQAAAWIGLTPREHSSGEKHKLLGISKQGHRYLRTLLVNGARACVRTAMKEMSPNKREGWIQRLVETRGYNKAVVTLANKNARIAWAMLDKGNDYQNDFAKLYHYAA